MEAKLGVIHAWYYKVFLDCKYGIPDQHVLLQHVGKFMNKIYLFCLGPWNKESGVGTKDLVQILWDRMTEHQGQVSKIEDENFLSRVDLLVADFVNIIADV